MWSTPVYITLIVPTLVVFQSCVWNTCGFEGTVEKFVLFELFVCFFKQCILHLNNVWRCHQNFKKRNNNVTISKLLVAKGTLGFASAAICPLDCTKCHGSYHSVQQLYTCTKLWSVKLAYLFLFDQRGMGVQGGRNCHLLQKLGWW